MLADPLNNILINKDFCARILASQLMTRNAVAQRIRDRIVRSIGKSSAEVFLRSDFKEIGSYAQVGKALNSLSRDDGRLMRMGYGIYAKALLSSLSGRPVPRKSLAREALKKLGVVVQFGRAAREYISGSTQIPAVISFDTGRRRISRKLRVGGREVRIENGLR